MNRKAVGAEMENYYKLELHPLCTIERTETNARPKRPEGLEVLDHCHPARRLAQEIVKLACITDIEHQKPDVIVPDTLFCEH